MSGLFAIVIDIVYTMLSFAWAALPVIGMWMVFEKAGEPGWKALIPFYSLYIMFKIGERKKYWWMYLIGSIVTCLAALVVWAYLLWAVFAIVFAFGAIDAGWNTLVSIWPIPVIAGIIAAISGVVSWIALIFGYAGICKKMNQGIGMVLGLVFLAPIFWMILGVNEEYKWQHKQIDVQQQLSSDVYYPPEENVM